MTGCWWEKKGTGTATIRPKEKGRPTNDLRGKGGSPPVFSPSPPGDKKKRRRNVCLSGFQKKKKGGVVCSHAFASLGKGEGGGGEAYQKKGGRERKLAPRWPT